MNRLRLSYSSLNTFESCARKFEFRKLYPQPEGSREDSYAGAVGSALHAGYQDYLVHQDRESAIWQFLRAFPYHLEYEQPNDYRSLEAALSTLDSMFSHQAMGEYQVAKIRKPNGEVVPAIEVPFEIIFDGIILPDGRGVSIIGYIDAIMMNLLSGLYRTFDIKTQRMGRTDRTAEYKFNAQQVPYGMVVEQLSQGAMESFEVLYLDCYIDLVDPYVQPYKFVKNSRDVEEWCKTRLMQINRIKHYMELDFFPRTSGGCTTFKQPCFYLSPCASRDRKAIMDFLMLPTDSAVVDTFEPWVTMRIDVES